jgi:Raf kinase inhibitor-like YbhB/YbcL family protein
VVVRWIVWLVAVAAVAGCGGGGNKSVDPARDAPPGIELTSSAFSAGGAIPRKYTCDGDETSPPLKWADVPDGTKSLALLVEDPDAPGGTYTHWTVYDIPATARAFEAGKVPAGSKQGENSFGDDRYGGPCPPEGAAAHRYVFQLYALRAPLGLDAGAKADDVRGAIKKQAIARGRLVGTFKRG